MITSAVFDLETSNFNADFGIILCACVLPSGAEEPTTYRADWCNRHWKTKRSDDSGIVKAVAAELEKYDILIAHNGARFDLPFLRTRMARWGLGAFPKKKLVDPVLIARSNLKLGSNSLEALCNHLGIKGKTEVDGRIWLEASLDGSKAAMDEIAAHCAADVQILAQVVEIVKGYCSQFDHRGSSW